jgi:tetratricopeptide (TPR) repeat protein
MTEEEDIALIDRFMEGSLSRVEAEAVKKRIETDKEFALLYNDMKYLLESTRVVGRKDLIEFLKKSDQQAPARQVQWYWISGIAATVAIIVAFFVFRDSTSGNALVDEYFVPYPNTVVPVVRGVAKDSSLRAIALEKYEQGDYAAALESLNQIEPAAADDLFYKGLSALGMKDYDLAVKYLKEYEATGESFSMQNKWYLALAYLGVDDRDQSLRYLDGLARGNNGYKERAAELAEKIRK